MRISLHKGTVVAVPFFFCLLKEKSSKKYNIKKNICLTECVPYAILGLGIIHSFEFLLFGSKGAGAGVGLPSFCAFVVY